MFTIKSKSDDGVFYLVNGQRKYHKLWIEENDIPKIYSAESIAFKTAAQAQTQLTKLLKVMTEYQGDKFTLCEVEMDGNGAIKVVSETSVNNYLMNGKRPVIYSFIRKDGKNAVRPINNYYPFADGVVIVKDNDCMQKWFTLDVATGLAINYGNTKNECIENYTKRLGEYEKCKKAGFYKRMVEKLEELKAEYKGEE